MASEQDFSYRDVQQIQSIQNFSTPQNAARQQDQTAAQSTPYNGGRELSAYVEGTPSSESRLLGRPVRKARITLDEKDHLVILRSCNAHKDMMTIEGKKTAFWDIIRQELLRETGKDLSLPKQVMERAMRDRWFHLEEHPEERGKPAEDEATRLTDEWMAHMEKLDGPEPRWKTRLPPVPRPKRTTPSHSQPPASQTGDVSQLPKRPHDSQQANHVLGQDAPNARPIVARDDEVVEGMDDIFSRPPAQPYTSVYGPPQSQPPPPQQQQQYHTSGMPQFTPAAPPQVPPPPPAKRPRLEGPPSPQLVRIEGGLTKEDWMEIVGAVKTQDPRLPALEQKIDSLIDTTKRTHQLLIQLLKNQATRGTRTGGQSGGLGGVNGGDIVGVNGDTGVGGVVE